MYSSGKTLNTINHSMLRISSIKSYLRYNAGFLTRFSQLEKPLLIRLFSSQLTKDELIAASLEYRTQHQIVVKTDSMNLNSEELLKYLPIATFDNHVSS